MRLIWRDASRPMCFHVRAAVGRFVNAVAVGQVGAEIGFAGADIDDIRIRWRHGDRANRRDWLAVKNRLPGNTAVNGLPHPTAHAAEVINVWLAFNPAHGNGASATVRADHAPAQPVIKVRIKLL